jgi:hypothetical protein
MEPMTHRGGGERAPLSKRKKPGSALEDLQRRFVEGQLSISEYEQELDRLEKID